MPINIAQYQAIISELSKTNTTLVAVSKTKPAQNIQELYDLGQRDFGENYVQEMSEKIDLLPKDIRWHFIGHLQSNKVKYIAPFVHFIHGVDSLRLLQEIDKQAKKNNCVIQCLLQMHIAQEETKFGFSAEELHELLNSDNLSSMNNIVVRGLMGMASFTENMEQVREEFKSLKKIFDQYKSIEKENCRFDTLSMGMSADYKIAIEEGSNMVRIGSLLFGARG